MMRPRLPVTILTAALSAAAIDVTTAVATEKGRDPAKSYAVVGQSSASTAATGRQPLAKRIAAANQPIRAAAPLADIHRPLYPPSVVAPLADGDGRTVESPTIGGAPDAPAPVASTMLDALVVEVPLPETDVDPAVAAPGHVAAPPLVVTLPAVPAIEPAPTADWTSATIATGSTPAAGGVENTPFEAAATTPQPRIAAVPRVEHPLTTGPEPSTTPILDRFRSGLQRVPRPLGLISGAPATAAKSGHASPPSTPRQRQPQTLGNRGAMRHNASPVAPIAAADEPTVDGSPSAVVATTLAPAGDQAPLSATMSFAAPDAAPVVAAGGDAVAGTTDDTLSVADTNAEAAPDMVADDDAQAAGRVDPSAAAGTMQTVADAIDVEPATIAAREPATDGGRARTTKPLPAAQRDSLTDRLRMAMARIPRPLGLIPAPTAGSHGHRPQTASHRHTASPHGHRTVTPHGVRAADPVGTQAAGSAAIQVAGEATAGGVDTADALAIETSSDDASPAPDAVTVTTSPIPVAENHPAVLAEPSGEDVARSADAPAVTAEPATLATAPVATAHRRTDGPRRVSPHRDDSPRTIRDHLGAAFAGMPRPFGLLPAPSARPSATHRPRPQPAPAAVVPHPATQTRPTGVMEVEAASVTAPIAGDDTSAEAAIAFGPHPTESCPEASEEVRTTIERVIAVDTTDNPAVAETAPADDLVTLEIGGLPETATRDEAFAVTITVHNRSPRPLTAVRAALFFADGIEPIATDGFPAQLGPGMIAFDPITEVAAGTTITLPVRATGTAAGTCRFRVSLACPELDQPLEADGTLDVSESGRR